MKDFIPFEHLFKEIKKERLASWIDKVSFLHLLTVWFLIILAFGFVYYFLQNKTSFLFYTLGDRPINTILNSVYFSFITGTTTGFGDIVPLGFFRVIAIFEVVLGFILLATVTSKLVSIKQNKILEELYELSINEKVNRLRSSLLLFRQNLDRIISKVEDGSVRKREIASIYLYFASFEDSLNETLTLIGKTGNEHFIKKIDIINAELIFNSILNSFEKINELISEMNHHKIEWKTEMAVDLINLCLIINEDLFKRLDYLKDLRKETLEDLVSRRDKIKESIKSGIGKK